MKQKKTEENKRKCQEETKKKIEEWKLAKTSAEEAERIRKKKFELLEKEQKLKKSEKVNFFTLLFMFLQSLPS